VTNPIGASDLSALSILVIDDSRNMRSLIRVMLRAFGIVKVTEAVSAEAALAMLNGGTDFDIILTDLEMEPIDGLEFVRRLRRAGSPCPLVPVIMMAGSATRDTVATARDDGVTEFLAKPIAPKALALRIWSIIARPRPFVRTAAFFGPCRRRRPMEEVPDWGRRSDDHANLEITA